MPVESASKLLRIHITGRDQYQGRPLYEAIVDKCRELHIAGATVFRGHEGFGDTAEIHRPHLLGDGLPIVIQIVDSAINLDRLLPAVEAMLDNGFIAISEVTAIRVQKAAL